MRLLLVLTTLALLPLAVPSAQAAHQGACWHEYAEGAVWALGQTNLVKAYMLVVGNCHERLKDAVCYAVTGNEECVMS